jgi:hypothetical protein
MKAALTFVLSRYDWRSAVVVGVVVGLCTAVGITWWKLLLHNLSVVDWVLVSIWLFMTAVLAWDVRFTKDIPLFIVAACGGLVIEWWGTNTELWRYFTRERPPLWILVAWPVAAMTTDRIAFAIERIMPPDSSKWKIAYWTMIPLFVVGMAGFMWRSIDQPASMVVMGIMFFVLLSGRAPRRDVILFVAGTMLGFFLEYWGTTRGCWRYYTGGKPPFISIVAHGFASVAFARGLTILMWCMSRVGFSLDINSRAAISPAAKRAPSGVE